MIRFALFGAGRIGRMHAENLVRRTDAELAYVVDTKPEAARALAEPLGARQADAAQALADPAVDAVLIASSTGSHADLSIAAARAGKAIFCEKPVDLTLPKVDACIRAVQQGPVPMFVGFNRRFDPHFRALKQRLDAGAIGKVEQVIITNRDPGLPEMTFLATSGGLFLDFTIHDFDMARWLLGEEPVGGVRARRGAGGSARAGPKGNDIDTAMLLLRTASGKMCQISNTRRAVYGYDQRIEVFGSKGMLRADNARRRPSSARAPTRPARTIRGRTSRRATPPPTPPSCRRSSTVSNGASRPKFRPRTAAACCCSAKRRRPPPPAASR
jgi:myo-inositol 2-dehydrogenase/D-chiro-inositol 1-dehydrogenase